MKKIGILILIGSIFSTCLFAGTSFDNLDINLNDEVLFTVKHNTVGSNPYKSIFYTQLKDGMPKENPKVITCYPEQMEMLAKGKILQIRNRYGTARYSLKDDKLVWLNKVDGIPVNALPVVPYSVSPDGKYFCYIQKTSLCAGSVILEESETGKKEILSDNVLCSYTDLPLKWAPDSTVLLYEKDNNVYFCNPDAVLRGVEIEERYRKVGRGTINSVCWASPKSLAYIDDYMLYKINTKELYTLGLYAGIIGQGKPMGRLPFRFDSNYDKFSANEDVDSIVIIQNKRLFSYLISENPSCEYMNLVYSRPYDDENASLIDSYLLWDAFGNPILWQEKLPYNGEEEIGSVYKLSAKAQQVLEIEDSGKPFLSPNGRRVAFFAGSVIYVYDINSWTRLAELDGEKIISAIWMNNDQLYIGGEKSIRLWNIATNYAQTITLSSAIAGYWSNVDYSIIGESKENVFYKFNSEKNTWKLCEEELKFTPVKQNGRYRIFTGSTTNSKFENAIYVRTLNKKPVTKPIFKESVKKSEELKKVALVFDLYDNADGLSKIISTLKKYNASGTFFINGEFIRRYPAETKQIVANGYSCASMFFSPTDLTDNSFVINEDFVRRGLARNEDEFYACTNKELALAWHAPFYAATKQIIEYGNLAGYTYVDSCYNSSEYKDLSIRPEKLIQEYLSDLEKTDGGVISITAGYSGEYHKTPLYDYLDLLICILIDNGYEFVDISEL